MLTFSTRLFAHRGLHQKPQAPENSMAAFQAAVRRGYGIELDVRRTADGMLVVFHDSSLERLCGVPGKIEEMTWAQLQDLTLGQSQETIPLFSQVLELVHGQVPLLVELKMEGLDPRLCALTAEALDSYSGPYALESFHPYVLYWFRRNRPLAPRGQLITHFFREFPDFPFWQRLLMQSQITLLWTRPNFYALDRQYRDALFSRFLARRRPVFGWTFRSRKELQEGAGRYDFYICEREAST